MTTFASVAALFVCPACRGELKHLPNSPQGEGLACEACALLYPIRDEIPVLLVEEAIAVENNVALHTPAKS